MNDKETERTAAVPIGGGFIGGMKQAAMDECASRMTVEGTIRARIDGLRREIAGLEALLRALPREMPFEADEALWRLVISQR